jgi:aryl-alcohol dehydrogenase-like predicted oxidoreductase
MQSYFAPMKSTRRQFLARTALGVSTALLAPRLLAETKPAPKFFDPYEIVPVGRTKLKFSRVILGTGMRGGNRESNHTRLGKKKFEALIRETNERGVNTFDLADLYGSHPYVIPALKGIPRDKIEIITKIWFAPGGIPEPERPDADAVVERFLRELKTDYIDLLLLHCVMSSKWPEELRKQMDLLSKLKEKGTIRALGVSCHSLGALEACITEPWVESVHTRINPYGMSMDGAPEKVVPVLRKIHAAGKGVVGMKIIGEGRLRSDREKRQASIKYALELGCVDVLNVGCESIAEVEDLTASIKKVQRPV